MNKRKDKKDKRQNISKDKKQKCILMQLVIWKEELHDIMLWDKNLV